MEGKNQLHTTKRGTYRILWTKFVTPLIVHRHSSGCSPTLVGRWAYTMGHFLINLINSTKLDKIGSYLFANLVVQISQKFQAKMNLRKVPILCMIK